MAKQIRYDHFLHGGDYNPEQWLDRPDILKKDIEYFKKAHINTVSMGMFSWAVLEPEEGKYNFDWLEAVINNLYKEGIYTILTTVILLLYTVKRFLISIRSFPNASENIRQ